MNLPPNFTVLQDQLLDAAQAFASDAQPLADLLTAMVGDVARATNQSLEIFPVCHHSPASALQMVQRLHARAPKVIYIELCEDLLAAVAHLRDCKLPVALQAFAEQSEAFPPDWAPLSVVAPLTEASAEYQAIAYALQHAETELVFVDRAVDFVFQWMAQKEQNPAEVDADDAQSPSEEAKMHGEAVAVQVGRLEPTFGEFLSFLLRNANVRHFAEWWDQYVEQAIIGADYDTYRQIMFLIGSLMRRLGRKEDDLAVDRLRERYMWTRMKQHMTDHDIAPEEAIYICGAAHTASDVPEFGLTPTIPSDTATWEIPARSNTKWLYGLLPSSFAAIEYQFGQPAGTLSMGESTWKKSVKVANVKPFRLTKSKTQSKRRKSKRKNVVVPQAQAAPSESSDGLVGFLTKPPAFVAADEAQLLAWCADIVALARKNGYLASTADSIAIYETSLLLANMRNRAHPSPYDFQDAAITCLEKDRTPKKRNIEQLCQILLGGDRVGMVGYGSLPPLAQNVYDRLEPLSLNLLSKRNQRALMDFKAHPDWLACSDLLWRLNYLLGNQILQPIMGERALGHKPLQESWEIRIGKYQRDLIQLGYEGVTVEQVFAQRLRKLAFGDQATANQALEAAENSVLYLNNSRLTQKIGEHAIDLLRQETGAKDAPAIFARVRRLVHYYRATPTGQPEWIERFVATGYSHYATLLPQSFDDRGTSPEEIAGMLGFIFTLESLALSLGANRSQLLIAIQQASQAKSDPGKIGLLWSAEWLLKLRTIEQMRDFFDNVLTNPLLMPALPEHVNGFILALHFAPRIARFVVELISHLFGSVPDHILMPWLPSLILRLRPHGEILQTLIKEASRSYPNSLRDLEHRQTRWHKAKTSAQAPAQAEIAPKIEYSQSESAVRTLLFTTPATTNALARLLGVQELAWQKEITTEIKLADSASSSSSSSSNQDAETLTHAEKQIHALLHAQPATMSAMAKLF
ncbi:MAG: DUF5682 family protein [Ardenticatenaceae bacterium]